MKQQIKAAAQTLLAPIGFQLARVQSEDSLIGMDICLRGLALRGYAPATVLDVGAAHGGWTRHALQYWPQARYFLLEPMAERRAELKQLQAEHPNVEFLIAAAGREAGELPFNIHENPYGSSFCYKGKETRAVPVVKLDELVTSGQMPRPALLKLDVQGYELEVLAGARGIMRQADLILLEISFFRFAPTMPLFHEVVAWMVERGFLPYEIVDTLRRPHDNAMGQCDILFARHDHPLLSCNEW